jgi:hypothetical protein
VAHFQLDLSVSGGSPDALANRRQEKHNGRGSFAGHNSVVCR